MITCPIYHWAPSVAATLIPAFARCTLIFKGFEFEGLSLETAANIIETCSSKAEQRLDWDALVEGFREFRPSVG